MMDEDGSGAQEEPSNKKKKKAAGDGKAERVQGADGEEDQPVGNRGDVEMGDDGTAEATGTSKAPRREHSHQEKRFCAPKSRQKSQHFTTSLDSVWLHLDSVWVSLSS